MFARPRLVTLLRGMIVMSALVVGGLFFDRSRPQPRQFGAPSPFSYGIRADTLVSWNEVLVTYIGDPHCQVCSSREFKNVLAESMEALGLEAARTNLDVRTVGVALSGSAEVATAFLAESGEWDEISIGNGWFNTHVQSSVWEGGALAMTPLLVITPQVVSRAPSGEMMFQSGGRTITRAGMNEIRQMMTSPSVLHLFAVDQ